MEEDTRKRAYFPDLYDIDGDISVSEEAVDFDDWNEDFDLDADEPLAKGEKRYVILIIYDITDNKKRNKMVKCLERYGVRVQKSAFEAFINKPLYNFLMMETSKIIDMRTDSLRIYQLNDHMAVRSWGLGDKHIDDVIIF